MRLPSSRFFEFAELLPCYEGAVRVALRRLVSVEQETAEPVDEMSPATLAAMSDHPGFPSIEFT